MTPQPPADDVVASLCEAVRRAGDIALSYFRPGEKTRAIVSHKEGGSPVTEADRAVDAFLKAEFASILPEAGWLSEESEDSCERLGRKRVLVVDPIDGTRAFSLGDRTWAVAAALVRDGRPEFGVIHAPALEQTYVAVRGAGAFLNERRIGVSDLAELDSAARVGAPIFVAEELRLAGLKFTLQPRVPSLALRIAYVASGALDAGFASENSHDWDIAAADLILEEAGGLLAGLDGRLLIYNRADPRHGVLTAAPQRLFPALNQALRQACGYPAFDAANR